MHKQQAALDPGLNLHPPPLQRAGKSISSVVVTLLQHPPPQLCHTFFPPLRPPSLRVFLSQQGPTNVICTSTKARIVRLQLQEPLYVVAAVVGWPWLSVRITISSVIFTQLPHWHRHSSDVTACCQPGKTDLHASTLCHKFGHLLGLVSPFPWRQWTDTRRWPQQVFYIHFQIPWLPSHPY